MVVVVWFRAVFHSEGSLLQMRDLGICFTLDPGPAVIALQLCRSSWSSPSVWNNQPEVLKVLQGCWGIKFVNVTSQRCDNPLWHFLLQKYKHQNWVSSHLLPVWFILSHFAGKAEVVQCRDIDRSRTFVSTLVSTNVAYKCIIKYTDLNVCFGSVTH